MQVWALLKKRRQTDCIRRKNEYDEENHAFRNLHARARRRHFHQLPEI